MNITRRDTVIIATLFNLLVLVAIIASGKMVRPYQNKEQKSSISFDRYLQPQEERNFYSKNSSDTALSTTTRQDPHLPDVMHLAQENSYKKETIADLYPKEDEYTSYDELDQLLEEYVLLSDTPKKTEDKDINRSSTMQSQKNSANITLQKPLSSNFKNEKQKIANQALAEINTKAAPVVTTTQINSATDPQNRRTTKQSSAISSQKSTKNSSVKDTQAKAAVIKTYIVQPGDNPWTIAKKCKISFEQLLELNDLDEAKAKNLKIGQTLKIVESASERE